MDQLQKLSHGSMFNANPGALIVDDDNDLMLQKVTHCILGKHSSGKYSLLKFDNRFCAVYFILYR